MDAKDFSECLTEPCAGAECEGKILSGWCYVDAECYAAGDFPPGQRCELVCDPNRIQHELVAPCDPGQTCTASGECIDPVVPDADAGTDTATDVADVLDTGPDVAVDTGSDVTVDTGSDVTVDTGSDVALDTGTDVALDTGTDVALDTGTDVAVDVAVDAGTDVAVDAGTDVASDVAADVFDASLDTGADGDTTGADATTDAGPMPALVLLPTGFTALGPPGTSVASPFKLIDHRFEITTRVCNATFCISGGLIP